ncbi:MAG: sulfotransferase [Halieaceae bacterium]|jgi:hypothetical protein|nr:sulfotransferase [Halieaceae bacterium]
MKNLDFIIIGAQKSATTALYAYLREHPQIAMPAAKEAPFFDGDISDAPAWEAFSARHFPAPAETSDQLWGKASPQYMGHPEAPARIARLMPQTRLVAILRDPVERAWSHYQMCRRREVELRDFEAAMDHCLTLQQQCRARVATPPRHTLGYESEAAFYLAWSEYGRILQQYLFHFPREQILVLTTQELKQDPAAALDRVLAFIGLAPGFRPANLGDVVHKGGGAPVITAAQRQRLRALAPLRWAWHCIPESRREALRYWFDQKNVRKASAQPLQLTPAMEARLRAHFAEDIAQLEQSFGLSLPWSSRYASAVANCDTQAVA